MANAIDLNCDCGEGFGAYAMGDDAAMLDIVSSASVACGFHAGDPQIMADVFSAARARSVALGAHPGYPDLWGFGRRPQAFSPREIERLIAYQLGAAAGVAALASCRIAYVKPHGALSNLAMTEAAAARAIARAVRAVDRDCGFLAVSGSALEREARAEGLDVAAEIYADRAYGEDGLLAPRAAPGAVLTGAQAIADRALMMIEERAIITMTGRRIGARIDSICVHGDHPGAVEAARALRRRLEGAGVAILPFRHSAGRGGRGGLTAAGS